jgi:hypothetical protein
MNPVPSPEGGAGAGARGLLPSLQVGQRLQDIPAQQNNTVIGERTADK